MFVGHLAVALGAKRVEPRVPLWALVAAALGLDLIFSILLPLGLESVRISPSDTAFTNLAFVWYPWSHGLLAAVGWAGLATLAGRGLFGSWRAGALLAGLVLSHWVLDFVTHRPDLPLWPGGPVVGLGLWNSVVGTILVEGGLVVAGFWLYLSTIPAGDRANQWSLGILVALMGLIGVTGMWSPPPPTERAVAWVMPRLLLILQWTFLIVMHGNNGGEAQQVPGS
jgi:hypothetical protein